MHHKMIQMIVKTKGGFTVKIVAREEQLESLLSGIECLHVLVHGGQNEGKMILEANPEPQFLFCYNFVLRFVYVSVAWANADSRYLKIFDTFG